ncbi:hypothetical protein BpHYR1_023075, partial [Brachionus plicatilis]
MDFCLFSLNLCDIVEIKTQYCGTEGKEAKPAVAPHGDGAGGGQGGGHGAGHGGGHGGGTGTGTGTGLGTGVGIGTLCG